MNSNLFVLSVCAYRNMCIYKVEYGKLYFIGSFNSLHAGYCFMLLLFSTDFFQKKFFIKLI